MTGAGGGEQNGGEGQGRERKARGRTCPRSENCIKLVFRLPERVSLDNSRQLFADSPFANFD